MKYRKFSDLLIHPPGIVKRIFDGYIWRIDTERKDLFLSFDDGPLPRLTPKILQILAQYDAKASFFCVGDNVRKYPEQYQEIINEGHAVGNHSYSHLNGFKTSTAAYTEDVMKAADYINSDLFRPPYGKLKITQHNCLPQNFKTILWDVLSYDFDTRINPQQCFENVKKFSRKGSVIVFHDNLKAEKNMLYALQKTLDFYSKKGYEFRALDSILL